MANIPAIDGVEDPTKARVMLYQAGREVQAPLDNIGLLTTANATTTYQPLDADLTAIAALSPADGAVMIGNGSAWTADTTPTLTGLLTVNGQIAFPATANASANANTLDDYEEGTFTPTLTPSSGTFTSASATGNYLKIGNRVWVDVNITVTTIGTAAGFLTVGNYPFTSSVAVSIYGRNGSVAGLVGDFGAGATSCSVVTTAGAFPFSAGGQTARVNVSYFV